ncbi:nucleoside/nucleotide kinase family protein [Lentzea sp. CA-135723]|uniref:nucleoside/nucleotide kinase family protein n=1 Tax=Lentzea sp. CA-135723 TaxID=3239950 RepID=UPI003D8A843A
MIPPVRFAELVARVRALPGRPLVGICGPPGAGKSTLADRLTAALGEAICVGMDGYHLAQAELARLGRADRKGAPDTFDPDGYVDLLRRVRGQASGTVYAPRFHREIEEPVAGEVPVRRDHGYVVTEGNYLLMDGPWRPVRDLLDEVWFLQPDESLRRDRLVARHREFGRSLDEARTRTLGSDEHNAVLINATASRADLVISGVL